MPDGLRKVSPGLWKVSYGLRKVSDGLGKGSTLCMISPQTYIIS